VWGGLCVAVECKCRYVCGCGLCFAVYMCTLPTGIAFLTKIQKQAQAMILMTKKVSKLPAPTYQPSTTFETSKFFIEICCIITQQN
jgi:hypothetical protein